MAQAPEAVHGDEIHYGFIDANGNEVRNLKLQNLTADPTSPAPTDGIILYRSDTDKIRAYINGAWQDIATMADVTANGISATIVDAKGDIIVATAADTVARKAVGSDGNVLVANSVSGDGLEWRNLASADIKGVTTDRLIGRDTAGSGAAEEISLTNGLEFTGAGGIGIANAGVTLARMANLAANSFIGNNTGTAATPIALSVTAAKGLLAIAPADINLSATARLVGRTTAGAGTGEEISLATGLEFSGSTLRVQAFTGDIQKTAGSNATTIVADAVTYSKMQNVSATNRVLGRITAGAGDVEELTGTNLKSIIGTYAASEISFTPAQGIAATQVQAAIEELKTDMDASITAATEGKDWKDPVDVVSTAQRALTGLTAIDGYTPVAGDRILLVAQTAPAENGIWIAAAGAWARAADADTTADLDNATVLSLNGTTTKGDVYTQTATVTTVGTTAQTWVKTSEGNTVYTADETTLTLGGGTSFSIKDGGIDLSSAKIGTAALPAAKGGTGQTTYAVGDLLYASGATALSKLAGVATGNVLISGGVTTAPAWGKVGLTTHVTGTLALGNGGTGATTADAAAAALGVARVRAGALTGTTNSEVITHNLNTRDIANLILVNTASPYDTIKRFYWEATGVNTVTIYAASGANLPAGYRWVLTAV